MKKTIKQTVLENEQILKTLPTHTELRDWAINNGFNNRSAFPKFKAALLEVGIDYEFIKTGIQTQKKEELEASCTHTITLYVDAKASAGRYGICDESGNVVMHGRFFDNDDAGEQSKSELCAADKAIWFAGKVKEAIGAKAIALNLKVDAQWLTYQDHAGQKGYKLSQTAKRFNIILNVEWIPGTSNPADKWTWSDNNLASLAKPLVELL